MLGEIGMITDAFAAGFGATAAVALIGGAVLLRWQRNRLQFNLMQTAIERGVPPLQGAPPLWLVSLRQGVMILVLGIGLTVIGAVSHHTANEVAMPAFSATTQPGMFGGAMGFRPQRPMDNAGPDGPEDGPPDGPPGYGRGPAFRPGQNGPPGRFGGGPGGGPGGALGGPQGGFQIGGPPEGQGGPPRGGGNPAMERWHRAQDQKAVATVAMGSGFILALLGLVRVLFAYTERRYAGDAKGVA